MAARLEARMRQALASGELYEAAELASAAAKRMAREEPGAAVLLLFDCALAQLAARKETGAVRRGTELATQMVGCFSQPPDGESLGAKVTVALTACSPRAPLSHSER